MVTSADNCPKIPKINRTVRFFSKDSIRLMGTSYSHPKASLYLIKGNYNWSEIPRQTQAFSTILCCMIENAWMKFIKLRKVSNRFLVG